jgi:hypothetical protein
MAIPPIRSQPSRPDLLFFHSSPGRCLIAPATAHGRLALRQLCDRSMPRIGDALLLTAAQGEPLCRYLSDLRLSIQTWRPRSTSTPSAARPPSAPRPAPAPNRCQPLQPLALRLTADWCVMPLRRWITLRSLLTLAPGGESISIPLPPLPAEQQAHSSH